MNIDFDKNNDGLVPAIIQDATTKKVLMLGYMNEEAYLKTNETKKVTFFSRTKNRLWTKGEESGNFLHLVSIKNDCDNDTLLVMVNPQGPTCHKGTGTCWGEENKASFGFLSELEGIIAQRKKMSEVAPELREDKNSYVVSLFDKGINKIAQKVGEEAVEVVIEAKDDDENLFLNESADLLFHYLILLRAKGYGLKDIAKVLEERH
ncbi:bifunctional phosphoribosyl-AMP cyclohydrolase/phosphoribosyl-ATP diphosphatase HisIE [Zunongwangia profunda]|uniref:Histidine biosynthesis bifunctional protein HisIE n=2 Tax=Zunongwangia profunda TaxID=398743 RepID=D5BA28_ZUNPS|nr:bifunctional phosphoribosyl-AMP cyclohydrolase/phosphoribosyl-ATP diphosphatase HisIE [Zunongwangia profunda]ADF52326.1 bifunctional phosphoribosyl-AMP cyclohydrolase/phosphoribosyl-ATP pyrophosphatase protein [Zunongwangia profunda SM-A87]MAS71083.1 bifunctional phosphoribosyl-AMP cyclohydrolase/phosphoribosyl-ATP diphosphatase HisIE [Zunongwangia sp.]HCV82757.1 bifunctional phosphoribosyl-AMP cyclohydrolase/phosphoribosyl-ATP diphosphatase HisIE [Zunongwangia profunda]|tara:strand:- start:5314 stop:5931 length:618 start_codon:yes stop_codon:yes gene_type:complete